MKQIACNLALSVIAIIAYRISLHYFALPQHHYWWYAIGFGALSVILAGFVIMRLILFLCQRRKKGDL